jgi:uncharacterized protein
MKRRYVDRSDWGRILEREDRLIRCDIEHFRGWISELRMLRVREPLHMPNLGTSVCIADDGFTWRHFVPDGLNHVITAMYDSSGAIIQWYIDIVFDHRFDAGDRLYFDDLYLDVVVSPDGHFEIKDADELEEALKTGVISSELYDLAWLETNRLVALLESGGLNLRNLPTV